MLQDISDFSELGVDSFVICALTTESTLDLPILRTLIEACHGYEVTLHRAFDQVGDQELALNQAIDLGFHRILTSGGRSTVIEGLEQLALLSSKANGRIRIVPGGGISPSNLQAVLASLKPSAVHASCRSTANESFDRCAQLGSMGNGRTSATDLATVLAFAAIIGDRL